jgi:nicotinamidase-related amidase
MSDEKNEKDELVAEVASLLFAARHPRIEGLVLEMSPPPAVDAFYATRETAAALGLAFPREAPSPALRDRLMATLSSRRKPRQALVVLDMLVDHLAPGGALEVPRARLIVPALRTRIEAAREAKIPVVYVVDEHDADDPDLSMWGAHNVEGTGGSDVWPEIAPRAGDHVVKKPTYSAFFQSRLESLLDELKVDSLVLTGCLTEIGIVATATDALQRGYAVEVPPDSQAGAAEPLEQGALASMRMMAPFGPARKARLERLAA